MKTLLIILGFLLPSFLFSQELNIGGNIGTSLTFTEPGFVNFGSTIEYRPIKSFISINNDLTFLISNKYVLVTIPVYLKLIIGNKFRVCPSIGGFVRTNGYYGWTTGLNLELKVKERLLLFANGNFMKDYYKSEHPSHNGGNYEVTDNMLSVWISIGIKKNILN